MTTNSLKKLSGYLLVGGLLAFFTLPAAPSKAFNQCQTSLQISDSLSPLKTHMVSINDTSDLSITTCYEDLEAVEIYRIMEKGPVFTQGYITRIGVKTTVKSE